jgi:hypothetical protein
MIRGEFDVLLEGLAFLGGKVTSVYESPVARPYP